jgi:hypothetical protein
VPPTGALIIKNNDPYGADRGINRWFRVTGANHQDNPLSDWQAMLRLKNGGTTAAITAPLSNTIDLADILGGGCCIVHLSIGPDTPTVTIVWDGHKLVRQ